MRQPPDTKSKRGLSASAVALLFAVGAPAILVTAGLLLSVVFVVRPVQVRGMAMLPALADGDRVFITRHVGDIARGDIVLFRHPADPSASYIMRVVGLPGEVIEVRRGRVLVNGNQLDEPYLDPNKNQMLLDLAPVRLTEESYFVSGDNRDNSSDSRLWGPLRREFIYGKYAARYWRGRGD